MNGQRYRTSTLVVFGLALLVLTISIASAACAIWFPSAMFVSLGSATLGLCLLSVTLEMADTDDDSM